MGDGSSVILGAAVGAIIAGGALLLNNWLQGRREREMWIADKREQAYLKCLELLSQSRRTPTTIDGSTYLETSDYNGFMAGMIHVPAWMAMMQCYSSKESADKIEPLRNDISTTLKDLKAHERDGISHNSKNFLKERGISKQIEDTLPVVIECFQRELQA